MSTYLVSEETSAWRIVDDEAVIVHTHTSSYFSLNQTGTWIWSLLAENPRTVEEVVDLLATRYSRPTEEARLEVTAFFDQLREAELLIEANGSAAGIDTVLPAAPSTADPYEPPQLVKFGDLETLILSGE